GQQGRVSLGPQRVRDTQFDALLPAGFAELALEFAEGGMELSLILLEMKGSAHLFLGLGARAGIGHRQAGGDAVGREEKVSRAGFELAIKVQSKGRVTLNERLGLS